MHNRAPVRVQGLPAAAGAVNAAQVDIVVAVVDVHAVGAVGQARRGVGQRNGEQQRRRERPERSFPQRAGTRPAGGADLGSEVGHRRGSEERCCACSGPPTRRFISTPQIAINAQTCAGP